MFTALQSKGARGLRVPLWKRPKAQSQNLDSVISSINAWLLIRGLEASPTDEEFEKLE